MLRSLLRLPTSLSVTVLGVSLAGCTPSNPITDADTDVAVDASAACNTACSAMFSAVDPVCTPQANADGTHGCAPAPDSGVGPSACAALPMPPTATGWCCCDPVA